MNYLTLPGMDSPVSAFDICQAHLQLEADYNVGGVLRERPSNRRRNASTGVQLARMKFSPGMHWVDIPGPHNWSEDPGDDDVRDIYCTNVLKWGLPISKALYNYMAWRYTPSWLEQFRSWNNWMENEND